MKYATNLGCLRYCKSTIFQANHNENWPGCMAEAVVCDTAKVRFFKQITTLIAVAVVTLRLFAILQKYDFSSKSQPAKAVSPRPICCLRYCKSTIFQANHNIKFDLVVFHRLFAILQKYDFSSKSQLVVVGENSQPSCLRYCKSTIFQANHNTPR